VKEYILNFSGETAEGKKSILEILRAEYPEYLSAPCGGKGRCGKCKVFATGRVISLPDGSERELVNEEIKACCYAPMGNLQLKIPQESKLHMLEYSSGKIPAGGRGLGLAVDIGTTTVAMLLYDLETGKLLAKEKAMNIQRAYGADVISRLEYARRGALSEISESLQRQINKLAGEICSKAGRNACELSRMVICGNTIMEHFAAGLDPCSIAVPPFAVKSLFGETIQLPEEYTDIPDDMEAVFAPCVSAYVGGDLVSGLVAVNAAYEEETVLYIDVGTNAEIALGNCEGFVCCAAAAGPAFEGAELSCGVNGGEGAIDRVEVLDGDISVHVIGDIPAKGICGSGVIDAVAALLNLGVIGVTGRFTKSEMLPENLASRVCLRDGKRVFMLKDEVYLSVEDIRKVQLAKAAIRAGVETLLQHCGKMAQDIQKLYIAGGFGSYINVDNAIKTGLLPEIPAEKVSTVGNAALKGVALSLADSEMKKLIDTAGKCTYLDLSSSTVFPEKYLKKLNFR